MSLPDVDPRHGCGERREPLFPTSAHESVFKELYLCACAYFFPKAYHRVPRCPVQPRYNRLISGPTGVGKSHMAGQLAACLRAELVKVDFGDWIPLGARANPTTLARVASALMRSQRVIVLVDELDKMAAEADASSWSISLQNEVYSLLERNVPMDQLVGWLSDVGDADQLPATVKRDILEEGQQQRLFIIACGTWQKARRTHAANVRGAGFEMTTDAPASGAEFDVKATVAAQSLIPDELRCRFHSRILELRYPTVAETRALLKAWGFEAFVGEDPKGIQLLQQLDLTQGGIRELESLYADLVTARMDAPDLKLLLRSKHSAVDRRVPIELVEYSNPYEDEGDVPF